MPYKTILSAYSTKIQQNLQNISETLTLTILHEGWLPVRIKYQEIACCIIYKKLVPLIFTLQFQLRQPAVVLPFKSVIPISVWLLFHLTLVSFYSHVNSAWLPFSSRFFQALVPIEINSVFLFFFFEKKKIHM